MRDRRFVAAHRGGPLSRESHAVLARWAANCAERVLPLFKKVCGDPAPQNAIAIGRAWANGEVKTGVPMKASVAAHAAARRVNDKSAIFAARAAGQAVATAHFADHSMGALLYAVKALEASGSNTDAELQQQLARLPDQLRAQIASGIELRMSKTRRRMDP